jgi:photosystem II stability/assembly factor-like uncharacterized protein
MTTVPKGSSTPATGPVTLLIATRKGAWFLKGDSGRRSWEIEGPVFLGHIVHHIVLDPRDQGTLLMAARTGHLGPTVFRSTDDGKTWKEASEPPAFAKAPEGQKGLVVDHVFWLAPGHPSEPDVWYAGTSPQGLFRSEDGGDTWQSVAGFNDHPMRPQWTGGEQDGTPDGPKMHSILIDPRDANHMYLGMSSGGVFESVDKGNDWKPLNAGCRADFFPDPYPEFGHDPHRVLLHPGEPDILYQQNHCGIYRMDRQEGTWVRIGENMPKEVGDIGFPLVLHPRDPQTAWIFPMDGTEVWPRVSPGGKPAAYVTRDSGRTWQRLDRGLPSSQAWFTVMRQAMTADAHEPLGIYFGTTSGEVWASTNEGAEWSCIARHLPQIYAVESAESAR